jgi:Resolvase, N terminal domain
LARIIASISSRFSIVFCIASHHLLSDTPPARADLNRRLLDKPGRVRDDAPVCTTEGKCEAGYFNAIPTTSGLDAQRKAVKTYLNGGDWKIVDEYTEVESGKRSERPELEKALAAARLHRASLVVSKVDRLTRSVAFLSRLLESRC